MKTIRILAALGMTILLLPAPAVMAGELFVDVFFEEPVLYPGPLGQVIEVPGARLHAAPGAPLLPVKPLTLLLPYGHVPVEVRLEGEVVKRLQGTFEITPAQEPVPLSARYTPAPTPHDPAIYESDRPVPGSWIEAGEVQLKHGFSIFTVVVHPLSYRPRSGRVDRLVSGRVVLTTRPGGPVSRLYRARAADREMIAGRIDEVSSLHTYPKTAPRAPGRLDPGDFEYLVVTPQLFAGLQGADSLQALVDYRNASGMTAGMATLEWIRANYDGARPDGGHDDATRIRDFLTDAYTDWGTCYVLLVGDADGADVGGESGDDLLQVRKFYVEIERQEGTLIDYIPADIYYSCLDGTFDHDADGLYGEYRDGPGGSVVDLMAELFVGRAPADSASEVRRFVAKTLAYENAMGTWLEEVWMLGEWLFEGPVWGGDFMDDIIMGSSEGGFTTLGFASFPFFQCHTLYDRDLGDSWGAADLLPILDAGPHIINHLGHSNEVYNMRLENFHADSLQNPRPFFQYSQGCYNGSFDNQWDESGTISPQDCFSEHLVMGEHGAFAAVVNSRYGWSGYGLDGVSQRFHRHFWDAFFSEGKNTLGQALADSKEENAWEFYDPYFRWVGYESNLLGDPAVRIKKNIGTDDPLLGIYPPEVEFFARYGETEAQAVALNVVNDGIGALTWSAGSGQPWVTVSPDSGAEGAQVVIQIDPTGLQPGGHQAVVTFQSPEAGNSPYSYSILLTVIDPLQLSVPHVDSTPEIDGVLAPGEWDLALPMAIDEHARGDVLLYVQVSGNTLYLGVDDLADTSSNGGDQMRLYFDKNLDGLWPTEISDEGEYLLLNGGAYWWPLFNQGEGLEGGEYSAADPDHVQMRYGFQDGHRVYEMSVDLESSFLDVGPFGTFGMLFWVANYSTGNREYTGRWPWLVPQMDDQRFFGVVDLDPSGAELTAEPRSVSFEAVLDRAAPDPVLVSLSELSGGNLAFTAVSSQGWLLVSPDSGQTPDELAISIDHSGLELGTYHGWVELTSAEAWNSPYRIPVDLRVLPAPARLRVSPLEFEVVSAEDGPDPMVSFTVENLGGRPLDFECSHADGWLVADPVTATLAPGGSRTVELEVVLAGLGQGIHQGELVVSGEGAEDSPASVQVHVEVLAPQPVPMVEDLAIERMDEALLLTWTLPDSPLVTGVVIRRDPGVPPAGPNLGTGVHDSVDGGEELLDSGLENGTRYCYAAFTFDQAGRYSEAATACGAPGENQAPPVPQHMSPGDGVVLPGAPELMAATVSDPEGDAVSYTFRLLDGEEGQGRVEGDRVVFSLAVDLQPGATYSWQVQAVDEFGAASDWSEPWSFSLREQSTDGGTDGGTEQPGDGGGCGCGHPGGSGSPWLPGLLALAFALRRRPGGPA